VRRARPALAATRYPMLRKPYRHDELARAVREVLDAPDAANNSQTDQAVDREAQVVMLQG
jgi:hypothetical protein